MFHKRYISHWKFKTLSSPQHESFFNHFYLIEFQSSPGAQEEKQATRLVVFRGPKRTRKTMLPLLQPARRHFMGYFKKTMPKALCGNEAEDENLS